MNYSNIMAVLLRFAVAAVFLFFGIEALRNPEIQSFWIVSDVREIIDGIIPVTSIMFIFGWVEIVVALLLITGLFLKYTLIATAALLLGITINVFFIDIEIALRDFAILCSILFLYTQKFTNMN